MRGRGEFVQAGCVDSECTADWLGDRRIYQLLLYLDRVIEYKVPERMFPATEDDKFLRVVGFAHVDIPNRFYKRS